MRLLAGFFEVAPQPASHLALVRAQLRPAENRSNHVVEIVGNSSGELADGFEFLRFEQLLGEHSFFGNVFRQAFKIFTVAGLIAGQP